jgi:hypothetical protein
MSKTIRTSLIVGFVALVGGLLPTSPAEAKLRKLYSWSFPVELNDTGVEMPIKGYPGAAEALAFAELQRCFSCSFPVEGAPRRYPRNGELLPLRGCIAGGRICKPAPVRAYTFIKDHAFQSLILVAQKGHFDGAGSRVIFRLAANSLNELRLDVTGLVVQPTAPDWVIKQFAFTKWNYFGQRLGTNMWFNQGCKPVCGKPPY